MGSDKGMNEVKEKSRGREMDRYRFKNRYRCGSYIGIGIFTVIVISEC